MNFVYSSAFSIVRQLSERSRTKIAFEAFAQDENFELNSEKLQITTVSERESVIIVGLSTCIFLLKVTRKGRLRYVIFIIVNLAFTDTHWKFRLLSARNKI